jgi:hypothetical protein
LAKGFWRIGDVAGDYGQDLPVSIVELKPAEATDQHGRDLVALLRDGDDSYYVTEKGEQAMILFREPPAVPDTTRSFILKARGYHEIHAF